MALSRNLTGGGERGEKNLRKDHVEVHDIVYSVQLTADL